jgi:hypothetical protein
MIAENANTSDVPNCVPCTNPLLCNPPNSSLPSCAQCNPLDYGGRCCNWNARPATGSPFAATPPLEFDCTGGCLFDLLADPTESNNLCASDSTRCTNMQSILYTANLTYYEPFRGCQTVDLLCRVAQSQFDGTYGPFLNVNNCSECVHTTSAYLANPSPPIPRTTNTCNCYRDAINCASGTLCVWNATLQYCDYAPGESEATWLVKRRWSLEHYDASEYEAVVEP